MTKEEKIIATAFTGKMFIDGSEMGSLYEYMEKKVGHGVIDLMLASKEFWEKLHKACEQDFIDMVSKEQPSLPSNLDEAAKEWTKILYGNPGKSAVSISGAHGFKAGAEWMAGQGETHEHYVIRAVAGNDVGSAIVSYPETFEIGDKVVVQIRKK